MTRFGPPIAGIAVVVGGGSLLLANDVTSGTAHRGAMVALFLAFLVAALTLLGMGVASADRIADDELAVATLRTRRRPVRTVTGRVARGAATSTRRSLAWAAHTSGAGAAQLRHAARTTAEDLRRARTNERGGELHDARGLRETLQRVGRVILVTLGLPPEEDELPPRPWMAQPLVRPRPAHAAGPRRAASYHMRTRVAPAAIGRRSSAVRR